MKKILIILSVLIIVFAVYRLSHNGPGVEMVKDFSTCTKAGYPVMESYPRQCRTPEGTVYVENIEVPKEGDVVKPDVSTGDHIKSPFVVTGKARGNWFFEGSFPVVLLDGKGKEIVRGVAQAQGEWMTEAYVPFKTTLTFDKPTTDTGVLVFQKDNPSGEALHDSSYKVAVIFDTPKTPSATTTPPLAKCVVGGCSGQICADTNMVSTCEYTESYACYKKATCERQSDGKCGWTPNTEFNKCLKDAETPKAL